MRYLKPLHPILSKCALLSHSNTAGSVSCLQGMATHAERREELHLLVSFSDCKWICDTLWKNFFAVLTPSAVRDDNARGEEFEEMIERLDLKQLNDKQHILEESVLYARLAALMVEADLQERQHASNMFTFDS